MKEYDEQRCRFCETQEGKVRPVGGFIVRLRQFSHKGQKVMACQKCSQKMNLEEGISLSDRDEKRSSSYSKKLRELARLLKGMSK